MKVGDYVRTTYGIGKITNAFVVYTDDGCIWHLSYMTNNPKIEIGIFTKRNAYELFGEVQKNHNIKYEPLNEETQKYFDMVYSQKLEKPICYVPVHNGFPRNASLYRDHKFIKSSSNILDLIEPQDLMYIDIDNGYAGGIIVPRVAETMWELERYINRLKNKEVTLVGIVTHEQLNNCMCKVVK